MAKSLQDRMARLAAQKQASIDKAKALDEQLRKLRAEQDRMAKISARKERNRSLIQTGVLAEMAGLLNLDRGTLLGGFLALAKTIDHDVEKARQWKQAGDAEISRQEALRMNKMKTEESSTA